MLHPLRGDINRAALGLSAALPLAARAQGFPFRSLRWVVGIRPAAPRTLSHDGARFRRPCDATKSPCPLWPCARLRRTCSPPSNWRSMAGVRNYFDEWLSGGLAPEETSEYISLRTRWFLLTHAGPLPMRRMAFSSTRASVTGSPLSAFPCSRVGRVGVAESLQAGTGVARRTAPRSTSSTRRLDSKGVATNASNPSAASVQLPAKAIDQSPKSRWKIGPASSSTT